MRLTADQIKQGILHPTRIVRDACVYYFADSFSTDPGIMPSVIQAIEEHGWDDAFSMYAFFGDLVQTEQAIRWAIDQLEQRRMPNSEEEAILISWLLDALNNADPALIQAQKDRIMELDVVDEEKREAIEERILLHGFTAEKLWQELEEFCDHNKTEDYLMDEDIGFAVRLVEAMGRHSSIFDAKVLELLAQEIEDYTDDPIKWMEPCVVRLAGELRLQQAIPLLVKKLHEDDEFIVPDCVRSLTKIGSDAVVDALANDFQEAEWGFRLSASEVFERTHTDRSVEHCLALLDGEEELSVRCRLLQSALRIFAAEATEPARQLVLNTDLDPDVIDVRNDLLVASMLMGVELPERERWQEDAKHDVEFRKKWYAEHYLGSDEEDEYPDDQWDDDYEDYIEEPPYIDDELPGLTPFQHDQKKAGRNDPCPCGSGKKFKKCCRKHVQLGGDETRTKFPIGTIAHYGPDDKATTKIVASVIKRDGAEPILERWVGSNVKDSPKVRRQIEKFFKKHNVKSVVATESNMGCPHEEGEDFPVREDCPFCPFWKGKQGSASREE